MKDEIKSKEELISELKEIREKYDRLKRFFKNSTGINSLKGTETILVLDDNELSRTTITQMIEKYGYTVLQAGSSQTALDTIQTSKEKIHLILADVVMPGENGPEAVKKILAVTPHMKVVYMSGYVGDEIIHDYVFELIQADQPVITKPFTLEDIGILLKQQLLN